MYTGKLFLIFLRYSVTRLNKYFMFRPLFFLNNPPINGVCWVDWLPNVQNLLINILQDHQ